MGAPIHHPVNGRRSHPVNGAIGPIEARDIPGYIPSEMAATKQELAAVTGKVDTLVERVALLETKLVDRVLVLERNKQDITGWESRMGACESHIGLAFQEIGKCLKEADLKTGFDAKMDLIRGDIEARRARIAKLQEEIDKIDKATNKEEEINTLLENEGEGKLRTIVEDSLRLVREDLHVLGSRDAKVEAIKGLEQKIAEGERLATTFTVFSYAVEP